jgi:hypothetical protein
MVPSWVSVLAMAVSASIVMRTYEGW